MKIAEDLKSIAVLIDADNAQLTTLKAVLDEISAYGRIAVKKAYGNWKNPKLKNWETELKNLAIKPEQQFDYTRGKNATDISLTIGALDLLYTNTYDAFVLVSSDSDYTPLAIRLRESGVLVFGVGENKTPEPFRNACDEFILTEYLGRRSEEQEPQDKAVSKAAPAKEADILPDISHVHELLKIASEKYQDDDGWINVSAAGTYIKRVQPDFESRAYGYTKLPDLLKAFPDKYETTKYKGKGTANIFAYKLK